MGIPVLNRILVDTVERFQGSERDVIIYSCCINSYYQLKFVSNLTEEDGVLIDRKLNVALTRARKQMFITGVPKFLESSPLYQSLLKLIENGGNSLIFADVSFYSLFMRFINTSIMNKRLYLQHVFS